MDFDVKNLAVTLVFSTIGLAYFSYGKRQRLPRVIACSVLLMSYSLFLDSIWWNIGIGTVLSVVAFYP